MEQCILHLLSKARLKGSRGREAASTYGVAMTFNLPHSGRPWIELLRNSPSPVLATVWPRMCWALVTDIVTTS